MKIIFFNSMTNIKNLNTNLLDINQISFTSTDSVIYDIEYLKNLDRVNSLCLVFNDVDVYFECIDGNKTLVFALTDKNREALENSKELWSEIKDKIETLKGIELIKYEEDFLKIRFESDNSLPLGEVLNIPVCVKIAKSVFSGK